MHIRGKVVIAVLAILLFGWALLYAASSLLIRPQFAAIERNEAIQSTARAADALTNWIDGLQTKASDWSAWDDTYRFMQDNNKEYIASNLVNGSLANLDINFMLFIDTRGEIIHAKGIDTESDTDMPIPSELTNAFTNSSQLLATDLTTTHQGIINGGAFPIIFVSRPIVTSSGDGPLRGTLVFGQYFTPSIQQKLASVTHLDLSFYQIVAGRSLPANVQAHQSQIVDDKTHIAQTADNTLSGFRQFNDHKNKPALLLQVDMPRTVFAEANKSLTYYLLIIIAVTAANFVFALYISRQIVDRDKTIALKDEFFSMASHELRTPLAAIRGNSQLIRDIHGADNPDLAQQAEDIHESSERLIRIVTNFLDAARLEQGKVPFHIEPVVVRPLLDAVAGEIKGIATDKKLYVRVSTPDDLPPIRADKDRLKQVIYNLVGNAIKYTDKGGITIEAHTMGDRIIISIVDTGRGLSATDKELLFQKFQQTRKDDISKGSGLGLYITKELIARMDGSIWLESSEVGLGTTVSFSLPAANEQPHLGA